jgi:electron transport complex protein RnfD
MFSTSPYVLQEASVTRVMRQVLLALLPGIAAYVYWFGPLILVQLAIATMTALAAEAGMLALRNKPVSLFLSDLSAVVTAWLLALTLTPLAPWWLTVVAVLFAIVVAKHLYGGLGQNPFNPAMIGFAVAIVSYPALLGQWPVSHGDFGQQLQLILGQLPRLDAVTSATPLDALKTGLKLAEGGDVTVASLFAAEQGKTFGLVAGHGWEWVTGGYLLGGVWLLQQGIIGWRVPVAFCAALLGISTALWLWQPAEYASPLFHLFGGGALLGAFFIATDPVSGSTTPRGKLIFGACAGLLAYLIRVFGGYPDGVAFAVLLMNIAAPLIDVYTQPPIFGKKSTGKEG